MPLATETAHAHARIAEAVIAGDAGLARHRMRRHLEAEGEFLRRRRSTQMLLPDDVVLIATPGGKRAEAVARDITMLVVVNGMRPGELLGTETELMEREGVSRAVLREAIRLLEHHEIARMRRGPGGGLFVASPGADAVTDIVAIYLVRRGMRLVDLTELRMGVELALVDLAAARVDDEGVALLHGAPVREEASADDERFVEVVHDLHDAVAATARNPVLELVALVLIRLSRLYQIERFAPGRRAEIRAEVLRCSPGHRRRGGVGGPGAGAPPDAPSPRRGSRPSCAERRARARSDGCFGSRAQ